MNKLMMILIIIGVILAFGVGYYLISPIFIVVEKYEPPPSVTVNGMEVTKAMVLDAEKMKEMMPEKVMDEAMPAEAKVVTALFVPAAHGVEGRALLIQDGDKYIVRFEDFYTINGPELHIYLAADTDATDYIDLGKIKATKGNVNYEVPAGVDIMKYKYVLIWCKPFSVLFSYAELA